MYKKIRMDQLVCIDGYPRGIHIPLKQYQKLLKQYNEAIRCSAEKDSTRAAAAIRHLTANPFIDTTPFQIAMEYRNPLARDAFNCIFSYSPCYYLSVILHTCITIMQTLPQTAEKPAAKSIYPAEDFSELLMKGFVEAQISEQSEKDLEAELYLEILENLDSWEFSAAVLTKERECKTCSLIREQQKAYRRLADTRHR